VAVQTGAELVEVVAPPEGPVERLGHGVVAVFEGSEPAGDLAEVDKVVRVETLRCAIEK